MNSTDGRSTLLTQFHILCENVCALIQEEGIIFRPYSNKTLPFFSKLNHDEQQHTVQILKDYFDICLKTKEQGEGLNDSRLMTRAALTHYGFTVDREALERINRNDLVQIYTHNQLQVFRSFRFFEISSYTLEDVLCRKWFDIYDRDPQIQKQIEKGVAEFLKKPAFAILDIPAHIVREKDTLERLSILTEMNCWAPLYNADKKMAGMIIIETSNFTL